MAVLGRGLWLILACFHSVLTNAHVCIDDEGSGSAKRCTINHGSVPHGLWPPIASPMFLKLLSMQLEALEVDYSNASNLTAHATFSRQHRGIYVGELHPRAGCPPHRYLFVDADWLVGCQDASKSASIERAFGCATRRGLIVALRKAPSAAGHHAMLNAELVPQLGRWGMAFDPISTSRLKGARFCCSYSREKKRTICCNKCCVNDGTSSGASLLFFVSDSALLSLDSAPSLGPRCPPGRQSDIYRDVGILMAADSRYLPVARTVLRVLRNHSELPAIVVGPDRGRAPSYGLDWPRRVSVGPLTLPPKALPKFDYVAGRSEYGFRMHKLPMLLVSPFRHLTIFLDSDVYPCSPTIMDEIVEVADNAPQADVFLMREGVRAFDGKNYVHGGILAFRGTPLARAFVRTWLRRCAAPSRLSPRHCTSRQAAPPSPADLVEYKTLYETSPRKKNSHGWSSAFEQPALTETSESFLDCLGPNSVHWLPTELLARPNTGQLGLYRARVRAGQPAAPLVHINPLKDWEHVQELVIAPGCADFRPFGSNIRNKVNRPSGESRERKRPRWESRSVDSSPAQSRVQMLSLLALLAIFALLGCFLAWLILC